MWVSNGFAAAAQYGSCYAFEFGGVPIIAAGTHGGLVGVNARNGQAIFTNPFASDNTASCPTPVAADGYVFWAAGYGKGGVCLKLEGARDRVSAQEAWTTPDMVCHHGGYIIHEGHIYGNNDGKGWSCINLASGDTVWKERGVGKGSLCFADGMLYLFSEKGGRAGLGTCSPSGLEMRGEFNVKGEGESWAHPLSSAGVSISATTTTSTASMSNSRVGHASSRSSLRRIRHTSIHGKSSKASTKSTVHHQPLSVSINTHQAG